QAQGEIAGAEPDDTRNDATDDDHHRQWHGGYQDVERLQQGRQFVQDGRAVGADREKCAGAEIDVPGVAAENVPGGRQDDVLQHDVSGEKEVFDGEKDPGQNDNREDEER